MSSKNVSHDGVPALIPAALAKGQRPKIAVVGSGIAGLGCAYFLHPQCDITVFEKNNYIGGHTNTVAMPGLNNTTEANNTFPMDTGFMVFNLATYPNIIRFFKALDIAYYPTDMSFSVQHLPIQLEWNGAGLNRIFGQRANLYNLRFWRMLQQLSRFNKEALTALNSGQWHHTSIENYAQEKQYGEDFLTMFLLPMSAAIWSTDPDRMRAFPIQALLHFFHNHGFLGLDHHHQWYTVSGGAQSYVRKLKAHLQQVVFHTDQRVLSVSESENNEGITLISQCQRTQTEQAHHFDAVILASHADESLALLAHPTPIQQQLLTPFQYEKNLATLHTDATIMPKSPLCWASWNYRLSTNSQGGLQATTHYWMNNLQKLPTTQPHFVSLNAENLINPEKMIQQIQYTHPRFDMATYQAQQELPQINTHTSHQKIFFCGSYFRYGFHEDAFTSALNLCQALTGEDTWPH